MPDPRPWNPRLMGGLAAVFLSLVTAASPAAAQQEKADKEPAACPTKQCPNVVVITNIDLDVSTWLTIQPSSPEDERKPTEAPGQANQAKAEREKAADAKVGAGLADLFAALGRLPTVRQNVVVITNVKVTVNTWLDLFGPPKKAKPEPAPKKPKPAAPEGETKPKTF